MRRHVFLVALVGTTGAAAVGQFAATAPPAAIKHEERPTPGPSLQAVLNKQVSDLERHLRLYPEDQIARLKQSQLLHESGQMRRARPDLIEHLDLEHFACGAQDDAFIGGVAGTVYPVEGPDIIVGDLYQLLRHGRVGNITAYSIGTISCNAGDTPIQWISNSNQHPVIAQHMYRYKNGRFEMIGQSWVKHGFFALAQSHCASQFGYGCTNPGTSSQLGVGCSDPYSAQLNGSYSWLGPKHEINASSGFFPYPYTAYPDNEPIGKRLQVHDDDLKPDLNVGAVYYIEGQYISAHDAGAGNDLNNASYRRVAVTEPTPFFFNVAFVAGHPTVRELPAIYAWKTHDPDVVIHEIDVPNDGRFIMASRSSDNGNGTWSYEFAVHNFNSDRSAASFMVPVPDEVNVTNVGFRDVPWHSGAPYDDTDWIAVHDGGYLTWSTTPFDEDPNANALRWGTLYNFRFDADVAPMQAEGVLGLFKPATGGPDAMVVNVPAPIPVNADLNDDGSVNGFDLVILLAQWGQCPEAPQGCPADLNNDGVVDSDDLFILLDNWG